MKAEDLGYADELLGYWEIRYPGTDGLINESDVESLELRLDGTWNPTPLWAKPEGRWGITVREGTGQVRLYFEERPGGAVRGHWLVLNTLRFGENEERMIHWQRTRYGAAVFADRILTGRWVAKATDVRLIN
jgi:hypothetical protein